MPVPFADAALEALLPPALAYVAAVGIAWPAAGPALKDPATKGKTLVVLAMPTTAVLMGFLAAFVAANPEVGDVKEWTLLLVGAAGAATALIQGVMARAGLTRALANTESYARFLVRYVMPETLVVIAFVVFFLQLPSA